jgi:DNA-binding transcriptional ArsR family regulator
MSTLSLLLSSGVRAEIFRLLLGVKSGEVHVRELQRQSGFSLSAVRQELKLLERLGLVVSRVSGNRTYFSGNQSHPLYPEIHGLVLKTCGLTDLLREALGNDPIRLAFVFGSIAGETESSESDIDLLVVGSISLRQLVSRLTGLSTKIGRELNPVVMTESEFAERCRKGDHFVSTVLSAPKMFLIGNTDELEAMAGTRMDSAP